MGYKQVYFDYFDYDEFDFIECELCGKTAVDIHHIEGRKMGGTKKRDNIENLMALCRSCHMKYDAITDKKEWLKQIHLKNL